LEGKNHARCEDGGRREAINLSIQGSVYCNEKEIRGKIARKRESG